MNQIKTIFIGTSEFGLPAFKALCDSESFEIIAVVTQPDRQAGRGKKLIATPIKAAAIEKELKIIQPERIASIENELRNLKPDLIIVASYGQVIPQSILDIPTHKCINIHGSLLPKYRGSSCIQAVILNGDVESGVTIMEMNAKLDAGAIICQERISIEPKETSETLHDKLSKRAGEIICRICLDYANKKIVVQKQDDAQATIVRIIKKENGRINWSEGADKIERFIRAMQTWPGAFSYIEIDGMRKFIKIIKAENIDHETLKIPGTLWENDNNLHISTGDGHLLIQEIQIEGGKKISGKEFLNGHKSLIGKQLQ